MSCFGVLLNVIQTFIVSVTSFILVIMLNVYKILTEDTTGSLDVHHAIAFLTKFVIMNCMSFSCGWLTESISALLKKLTIAQLVKFPAFCGTERFITMVTGAHHWSPT
jgi:hypothetical protein